MKPPLTVPPGYEVTIDGRVYSTKRRADGERHELRQYRNGSGLGYPCVHLYVRGSDGRVRKKNYAVYRLVAAAHLPPRPPGNVYLLHNDGNRENSHASNLRWGTPTENNYDAWRHRRARENYEFQLDEEPLY